MEKESIVMAEIIGPSGAGKSTLSALLNKSNLQIKAGMTIWGLPNSLLAKSTFISFPTVARIFWQERKININNSKQIVRLCAFYQHLVTKKQLSKKAQNGSFYKEFNALFLDEGVIFALSKLRADRNDYKQFMQDWEEKTLDQWAKILNPIIWLDAPNEILIERVRTREKNHRMKFKSDDDFHEFLECYRNAYANIVTRLQSRSDLTIMKFDTAEDSLEMIAAEIEKIIDKKISNQIVKGLK